MKHKVLEAQSAMKHYT